MPCPHSTIFVCFVSVTTFAVVPESLICSLLFSKCSAHKTATSRTDSSVLATISEFPRTCPHLFHSLPRTPFWIPGCQQTARFPSVYLFRPAYIYPVQPRKEPNFSYRLLRAIYLAFQLLFPN